MPCHTHIHMLDQIDYNHHYRWIVLNIYMIDIFLFDRYKEIATSTIHAGICVLFTM